MVHKRTVAIALFSLIVACCAMSFVFFAPRDMVSNTPVYSDDYAMHYSNALAAQTFWRGWGRCWGYDPYLLSGFPRCALANADNKAWEMFITALSPFMGTGRAFKAYVLGFLFFFPLLLYGAARNFEFSRSQALSCSFLAFFLFYLSVPKDFVLWGMLAYIFSCFFSIYVLSLLYRIIAVSFSASLYILTVICSALLFLNHILSPVHIFIPAGVMYVLFIYHNSKSRNLLFAAIPFFVAVANIFWLIPVFDFFGYKTAIAEHWEFTLQIKNIFEPLHVYGNQRRSIPLTVPVLNNTFFEALLLLLGTFGFLLWWKNGQRRLTLIFGSGLVFIFFVTYYGSHAPFFAQFQPQRFVNALNVLLLVPAGAALSLCIDVLVRDRSRFERVLLWCLVFVFLYQPVIRPFLTIIRNDIYRLTCTMPTPVQELVNFLEIRTTREGRILIEDSESGSWKGYYEPEAYYGTHLPGMFPTLLKREYLCGPRPMYPLKHSFASFTRGVLFDRPVGEYSPQELQAAMDLFNVRWVVCWFDESRQLFDAMPNYFRSIGSIDKFAVYEVVRQPSFFLKGSGDVHADYNRIVLSNLRPEDKEIIISYHWMKHLVTDTGAPVERVMLGGDPIGFIKITDPPEMLTIYNGY
jgi:hypothetical protein